MKKIISVILIFSVLVFVVGISLGVSNQAFALDIAEGIDYKSMIADIDFDNLSESEIQEIREIVWFVMWVENEIAAEGETADSMYRKRINQLYERLSDPSLTVEHRNSLFIEIDEMKNRWKSSKDILTFFNSLEFIQQIRREFIGEFKYLTK